MNVTNKPKLKNYYIAYFDILGYKSFFIDENDHQKLLQDILNIVRDVKEYMEQMKNYLIENVKYRAFSDNFIFYFEENEQDNFSDFNALSTLAFLMSNIQKKILAKYGILVRGAITKGEFYADDSIVFGNGLIRAVEIEAEKAIYPRIIIDNNIFKLHEGHLYIWQNVIKKDNDDENYVDYLFEYEPFVDRDKVRKVIIKLVNKYCKYPANFTQNKTIVQRERLITKYLWLLEKYNNGCDDKFRIDFQLKLNNRLLKTEVDVKS